MTNGTQGHDGQMRGIMNWCHKCGKWCEVADSTFLCSLCSKEWLEAYAARSEKEGLRN